MDAQSLIEEIVEMAEREDLPSAGIEFAESVSAKAQSIGETIEERGGEATSAQLAALENMHAGLCRWFRD